MQNSPSNYSEEKVPLIDLGSGLLTVNESVGSNELPIEAFKADILEKINNNPVTIITAETGAGKSTQVPQFLLDEGYEVVVTQPRRLAARSVADRVAQERGETLGQTVGFKTAFERRLSKCTKLLFCTDGLQLVKELSSKNSSGGKKVLVLDEVHEWNLNMETLVAWVKKQRDEGVDLKVVLMSATLDAEKLSSFFSDEKHVAPVVDVPGRLYSVEEKEYGARDLIDVTANLARAGRNVLVFQPGKKEIEEAIKELVESGINAEILPLHGQLDAKDQNKVFEHYSRPKIVVATNVAQTSITIDDIDAVVDSGIERRLETKDGIEGLYLRPVSKADCKQRKGRAGRCRPGIYALCSDDPAESRTEYPLPEIERKNLDQMILRLAAHGMDATELNFYHQPDKGGMLKSKESLRLLGALNGDGKVTEMGEKMSKLPVGVNAARMIIEAAKYNCVEEVVTIAACLEAGELGYKSGEWRVLTKEEKSDALAQLDIYRWADDRKTAKEMTEKGVNKKNYYRAREIRRNLLNGLRRAGFDLDSSESSLGERGDIIKSVIAGMVDKLYIKSFGRSYSNGRGDERLFNDRSVIYSSPEMVVGKPLDIQFKNRHGQLQDLSLLSMCTEVELAQLKEVAPHLFEESEPNMTWDYEKGCVVEEAGVMFNGQLISSEQRLAEKSESAIKVLCEAIRDERVRLLELSDLRWSIMDLSQEFAKLSVRANGQLDVELKELLVNHYQSLLSDYQVVSTDELRELFSSGKIGTKDFELNLEGLIGKDKIEEINRENPTNVKLGNKDVTVTYTRSFGGHRNVRLEFSVDETEGLSQDWLDSLGISSEYELSADYGRVSTGNLDIFLSRVEEMRLNKVWQNFEWNLTKNVFDSIHDINIANPTVYDEKTGSMAYAFASRALGGEYAEYWTRSKREADMCNRRILEEKNDDAEPDESFTASLFRGSFAGLLEDAIPSLARKNRGGPRNMIRPEIMPGGTIATRRRVKKVVVPEPKEVSLSEISEKCLYEELESIELKISDIYENYPDINEVFIQLEKLKTELSEIEAERTRLSSQRDSITGDRRKKIVNKLGKVKAIKKEVKTAVLSLEKAIKGLKEPKNELDKLSSRREDIEAHLS